MLTSGIMYFLVMFDSIKSVMNILAFILSFLGIVSSLAYIIIKCKMLSLDDNHVKDIKSLSNMSTFLKPLWMWLLLPGIFFSTLENFIPSTKQMSVIIIVPKIINSVSQSEELKKLPQELLSLSLEWLTELKPDKELIDKISKEVKDLKSLEEL